VAADQAFADFNKKATNSFAASALRTLKAMAELM
jgi:hypothetical protein